MNPDHVTPLLAGSEANFEEYSHGGSQRSENLGWLADRSVDPRDSPSARAMVAGTVSPAQGTVQKRVTRPGKRVIPAAGRARKMPWIVIDADGKRTIVHADKRAIIHSNGLRVPIRDMRLLDYNLVAADSTILVRDNAIIVSLEHVRVIVAADRAILPREGTDNHPLRGRFVDVLEEAVVDWARHGKEMERREAEAAWQAEGGQGRFGGSAEHSDHEESSSLNERSEGPHLPFELVVLEAAFKEVVASMGSQILELEGVALPALDALTKSVSTSNLERVRKVKTRHQRLMLRCEALRDELQRFLQDDDDMARMALTRRREVEESAKAAAAAGPLGTGGTEVGEYGVTPRATSFAVGSLTRRSSSLPFHHRAAAGTGGSPPRALSGLPTREAFLALGGGATEDEADADAQQEVENLLESYYMQVDALYDKLVSVGEYIKDTEEYINIELDSSRNRLIRMEIVLAVATFAIMPFNLVAGILGENLVIPEQLTGDVTRFYAVNVVACSCCVLIFYAIMLYMRHRQML